MAKVANVTFKHNSLKRLFVRLDLVLESSKHEVYAGLGNDWALNMQQAISWIHDE